MPPGDGGPRGPLPSLVTDADPRVLSQIREPWVGGVIWTRPSPVEELEFPAYAAPQPDELGCLPRWLQDDIVRLARRLGDLGLGGLRGSAWRPRTNASARGSIGTR